MDALLIIGIVIIGLVIAGGVWWTLRQRGQTPPADSPHAEETLVERASGEPARPAQPAAPAPPPAQKPAADEFLDPDITAALEVVTGPAALVNGIAIGQRLELRRKKTTIGRNPRQVDLQFYDLDEPSSVSRLHCTIEYYHAMKCFMITDEGSSSGTKVENLPITPYQPVALRDGDLIELGIMQRQGVVLRFHTDFNPPADTQLRGARLRLHMGIEAKDTIRQSLNPEEQPDIVRRDVFLSYSRRDRDAMRYLRESLTVSGFSVWTDESLEPGSRSWRAAVENAIENAGCVVALLSPDAKQSQWVGEEINYATIHQVRIFTVLVRGEEGSAVPLGLTGVQWIDMRADYDTGLEHLLRALREYIQRDE